MKCLHLCNALLGSEVHESLYKELDQQGLQQEIFYPLRPHKRDKAASIESQMPCRVIVSKSIRRWHRVLFRRKVRFLYRDLCSKTTLSRFDIAHATTLYSDGAIALQIYRDFGIPYIVAVRGTDMAFLRYRPDLHLLGSRILQHASKVVFISEALKQRAFKHHVFSAMGDALRRKSVVILNGISPYWLSNIRQQQRSQPSNIIYVGRFNDQKNVVALVQAVLLLRNQFPNLKIQLVGEGGNRANEIMELAAQHPECVIRHGPEYDREALRDLYRQNDIFAMTSISETFGLVYIEALTQGLPILFTENDGVDGSLRANVGCAVNPKTPRSIAIGLRKMIEDYQTFELNDIDFGEFCWKSISRKYLSLYRSCLK